MKACVHFLGEVLVGLERNRWGGGGEYDAAQTRDCKDRICSVNEGRWVQLSGVVGVERTARNY